MNRPIKNLSPKEQIAKYYQEGKTEMLPPQNTPDEGRLIYREALEISNLQLVPFVQPLDMDGGINKNL